MLTLETGGATPPVNINREPGKPTGIWTGMAKADGSTLHRATPRHRKYRRQATAMEHKIFIWHDGTVPGLTNNSRAQISAHALVMENRKGLARAGQWENEKA